MRKNQLLKLSKKKLSKKYSCFELEQLNEEIQEYQHLLKTIGMKKLTVNKKKKKEEEEEEEDEKNK